MLSQKHITLNHGAALLFTIKKLEKLFRKKDLVFNKFSKLQGILLVLSNVPAKWEIFCRMNAKANNLKQL